ncbi:hypothetical protein [Micromonospora sp. LOL_024]|uniref:hypothetical protein n=1 Tax=Micromonospora sp. LOL_024 TaxID=3345412 RepID=UPI003A898C99
MAISAHAPVPSERRLHDAPTADLTAIPRPRPADARFPVLNSGGTQLLDGTEDRALWAAVPAANLHANCPAWCPRDCTPLVTALLPVGVDPNTLDADEYFDRCRMHERFVGKTAAVDYELGDKAMLAAVEMQRFDDPDGKVIEVASVSLAVMAQKPTYGDVHTRVRLTPEQAEELGKALLSAALLAQADR